MENGCELVFSEHAAEFLLSLDRPRLSNLLYDLRILAKDPSIWGTMLWRTTKGGILTT